MLDRFEKLLQPGTIGPINTRNRMLKTANGTSLMEDDQTVGPRMVAYYERLAKGGVGYLVVESSGVEFPLGIHHVRYLPDGTYEGVQLHLDDDKYIPGICSASPRRCTRRVAPSPSNCCTRDRGTRRGSCLATRRCATSSAPRPSSRRSLPGPDFLPCRAMTKQEIEDMVDIWAKAAERAKKAGFDGCELNHGTCHQGNTFLSRVWNRRDDEYGPQSFENRTRFVCSIVSEVKRRNGPDFAVHVLMNIAEFNHPLATTIDEGAEMAKLVAQVADGINCRSERYGHRGGLQQPDRILYPEPPEDLPEGLDWSRQGRGATVPLVEAVKRKGVSVPVWTACRLDPELGEMYLRRGSLDFVGMTRRLLADPDLPNKIKEGRPEDIRTCHGCLHCFDCRNKNKLIECRVNATLGRELVPEYQPRPLERRKKVFVVGGGPAGMEAARVAAERGHEVTLYEKESYLGGLVPVAAIVKHLETQDMADHLRYLQTQLRKQKVDVHLGKAVTADTVRAAKPDVLVIAAGAAHMAIDVPGAGRPSFVPTERLHGKLKLALKFFSPRRLAQLTHLWMPVKPSVVIMGGTLHGCELAEFLVKRHREVVIAHDGPAKELGQGMTTDDLENLWPWFKLKRVTLWPEVEYRGIVDRGLEIQLPDKRVFVLEGKNVITTQDWKANTKMIGELAGLADETYIVGSSKEPGWIVDAIREGALAGYSV